MQWRNKKREKTKKELRSCLNQAEQYGRKCQLEISEVTSQEDLEEVVGAIARQLDIQLEKKDIEVAILPTNLQTFSTYLAKSSYNGVRVEVAKAFYHAHHDMLLEKPVSFGFSKPLVNLFRTFRDVSSCRLSWLSLLETSGESDVLQGSNFCPLLFTLFMICVNQYTI